MNDIEIINCLKDFLEYNNILKYRRIDIVSFTKDEYLAIQELLNLYNKEKKRNKDLEQIEKGHKEENGRLRDKVKKIEEYVKQCDWHNNDVYIGEDILELLEESDK